MPLDPGTAAMLQQLRDQGAPPMAAGTPAQARAGLRAVSRVDQRDPAMLPPVDSVREEVLVGSLRARVYRPAASGPVPTVVYLHGGGFVIGDLDTHDLPARLLVIDVGAVVVSVDYRLAPEHPYPAGVDDASAAVEAVASRIGDFGGDPARLVVAGDSAGANLAAVAALRAREGGPELAAQLLLYPTVDPGGEYPSRVENAEGYFLTDEDMRWFFRQYTGFEPDDPEALRLAVDPEIAPLRAASLAGLPPAVVATAQYDPLRDEGEAYATALADAGVRVERRRFDGLIHGFYGSPLPGPLAATHEINAMLKSLLASL